MIRCRNRGERPASEGHLHGLQAPIRHRPAAGAALIAMALLVYRKSTWRPTLPHMPSPPPTAGSSVQSAEELASARLPGYPGTARHLKNACSGGSKA
ncbi:hypothetical protein P4123_11810 [Pseudomonas aeruginosa]|nr:hypothetical protein [Pseudomonas aeruginosa]